MLYRLAGGLEVSGKMPPPVAIYHQGHDLHGATIACQGGENHYGK